LIQNKELVKHLKFRAHIEVRLKGAQFDPESETVKKSLIDLNFRVSDTKIAKVYEIVLDAPSTSEAAKTAKSMCTRLLANPTKDDFSVEVIELNA
jgi:phosphoribosylformylglycinamidine synthase subunit PurS